MGTASAAAADGNNAPWHTSTGLAGLGPPDGAVAGAEEAFRWVSDRMRVASQPRRPARTASSNRCRSASGCPRKLKSSPVWPLAHDWADSAKLCPGPVSYTHLTLPTIPLV